MIRGMRPVALALAGLLAVVATGCGARGSEPETPSEAWSEEQSAPWRGGVAPSGATSLGAPQRGRATFYADSLAGGKTASGERYDPQAMTAAHRTLPFGTIVEVARSDGRWVRVRINDRGPFAKGRIIDLSRAAAKELDMIRAGVVDTTIWVVERPPPKGKR